MRSKSGIIIKADFIDFERLHISQKGLGWDFENIKEMKDFIENEIVKHSANIIDLIEVGDYVNGERVFATENRINDNGEKVVLAENYDEWTDNGVIANKDIKTIVTKEQFESIEYRVE